FRALLQPAHVFTLSLHDALPIYALEQPEQLRALALDPEVHGVTCDEARRAHLLEYFELEHGIDVAEEDPLGVAERVGDLRLEVREHAEPRLERLAAVQVEAVDARPAEALAGSLLETRQVDAALLEETQVAHRVVVANDTDELHTAVQRCGRTEECGGSAQCIRHAAERCFDAVERYAADDQ